MAKEEQNVLPRYNSETSVELYNHLVMLRSDLNFNQLIGKEIQHAKEDRTRITAGLSISV